MTGGRRKTKKDLYISLFGKSVETLKKLREAISHIPGVGHTKALVHNAMGNSEMADDARRKANKSLELARASNHELTLGASAGSMLGGPVGALIGTGVGVAASLANNLDVRTEESQELADMEAENARLKKEKERLKKKDYCWKDARNSVSYMKRSQRRKAYCQSCETTRK